MTCEIHVILNWMKPKYHQLQHITRELCCNIREESTLARQVSAEFTCTRNRNNAIKTITNDIIAYITNLTIGKSFSRTTFRLRMELKERTETRQRWNNARRLPDIWKSTRQMSGSVLAFLHLFIVSARLSAPSLNQTKLLKNASLVFVFCPGLSKPPSKYKTNAFIVFQTNTYGAGEERVLH